MAHHFFGGPGNDEIFGEEGADKITGGTGADLIVPGMGAGKVIYRSVADSPLASAAPRDGGLLVMGLLDGYLL